MAAIERIIAQFAAAPLFQHVGEPIDDNRVQQVRTWKAAIRPRVQGASSQIYDVMMNRIRQFARTTHGEDWFNAEWNRRVRAVKSDIEAKLEPVVAPLLRGIDQGDLVEAHFYGDVMEAWMIAEFPEPASKPWLEWHWQWYEAGHFPAGWRGKLPSENHPDPNRLPELYRDGTLYVY